MQDHHHNHHHTDHHMHHHHADHLHHHQQQHGYAPAPQQHYAYPPVGGAPYGGAVNEIHHVHHHHAPSHGHSHGRVRVKLEPSCFGRGGFPEYVPNELRGRVADGDYVAHIRHLNSDLSRAGRWSWGILACFLGVMVAVIGAFATVASNFSSSIGSFEMPSVGTIWPWGVLAGVSIVGIFFFAIFSAAKTKSALRHHERHLNETLGVEAGLTFHMKFKVKKDKKAKKRYDPVLKKNVRPKKTKVTMIIDIGPLPTERSHQPGASTASSYDTAAPAASHSYLAPSAYQEAGPTTEPQLLMV